VQTPEDRPGVAQSDRWGDDFDRFGVGSQLGAVRWRASMVTCQRRCRRLPKRFSDRWGLWHFRPALYSKRPQRSRKPWKAGVNRVEGLSKPLGFSQNRWAQHQVVPLDRGGEEGASRVAGLSGCKTYSPVCALHRNAHLFDSHLFDAHVFKVARACARISRDGSGWVQDRRDEICRSDGPSS
jgi:hypothetical protein